MATIRRRNGKYQVQIRRNGHRAVSKTFLRHQDAVAWAYAQEVAADREGLPAAPPSIALADLVRRYRDTVTARKRSASYEAIIIDAFLRHPVCSRSLSELRTEHFAQYRDQRLTQVKASTVKRQMTIIRHLFEVARTEWNMPIKNPVAGLKWNGVDNRRQRRLRDGEYQKIMTAARSLQNKLVAPIIETALTTGMRRSEILAITVDHIDFERRCLLIPHTKTGYSRTIPLGSAAIAVLHSVCPASGRLFPISANAFRLCWDRVKKRTGIGDLHFHDCRHEAISRLFELGLSTPEVASISGHRSAAMLMRYAHADRQRVLAKLG